MNIDLFASRTNTQLKRFVSWKPGPEAFASDSFQMNWTELKGYAFQSVSQSTEIAGNVDIDNPSLDHTDMVPESSSTTSEGAHFVAAYEQVITEQRQSTTSLDTEQYTNSGGLESIRQRFIAQ